MLLLLSCSIRRRQHPTPRPLSASSSAQATRTCRGSFRTAAFATLDSEDLSVRSSHAATGMWSQWRRCGSRTRRLGTRRMVVRQSAATVQCVVAGVRWLEAAAGGMLRFAVLLSRESVVDVGGVVSWTKSRWRKRGLAWPPLVAPPPHVPPCVLTSVRALGLCARPDLGRGWLQRHASHRWA